MYNAATNRLFQNETFCSIRRYSVYLYYTLKHDPAVPAGVDENAQRPLIFYKHAGCCKALTARHFIILYRPFYSVRLRDDDDAQGPQSKRGGISVIRRSKDIICTYLYNIRKTIREI